MTCSPLPRTLPSSVLIWLLLTLELGDLVFIRTIDSFGFLATDPQGKVSVEKVSPGNDAENMINFYTWSIISKKDINSIKPLTIFDEIYLKSAFSK